MWITHLLPLATIILATLSAEADIIREPGLNHQLIQPIPAQSVQTSGASTKPGSPHVYSYIRIMSLVYSLAQQYDIDVHLVRAMIEVESDFNVRAISPAGAQGLMQLMPGTAARYHVKAPFDPRANIEGGLRYLTDLRRRFRDDLQQVLAAYNAGEGAVERYGGVPPYRETRRYITRVLTLYARYTAKAKIYRYRTAKGSILFTDTPR